MNCLKKRLASSLAFKAIISERMLLYYDHQKVNDYLSMLEEELREVRQLEYILAQRQSQAISSPFEAERCQRLGQYLKAERERIQSRKTFIGDAQEKYQRVQESNGAELDNMIYRLRQL